MKNRICCGLQMQNDHFILLFVWLNTLKKERIECRYRKSSSNSSKYIIVVAVVNFFLLLLLHRSVFIFLWWQICYAIRISSLILTIHIIDVFNVGKQTNNKWKGDEQQFSLLPFSVCGPTAPAPFPYPGHFPI